MGKPRTGLPTVGYQRRLTRCAGNRLELTRRQRAAIIDPHRSAAL